MITATLMEKTHPVLPRTGLPSLFLENFAHVTLVPRSHAPPHPVLPHLPVQFHLDLAPVERLGVVKALHLLPVQVLPPLSNFLGGSYTFTF